MVLGARILYAYVIDILTTVTSNNILGMHVKYRYAQFFYTGTVLHVSVHSMTDGTDFTCRNANLG